jgi:hypothetical protein
MLCAAFLCMPTGLVTMERASQALCEMRGIPAGYGEKRGVGPVVSRETRSQRVSLGRVRAAHEGLARTGISQFLLPMEQAIDDGRTRACAQPYDSGTTSSQMRIRGIDGPTFGQRRCQEISIGSEHHRKRKIGLQQRLTQKQRTG